MSDDLTRDEIHGRLDRFVMDLLDAAGVAEPPVDAVALALRHLRLKLDLDPHADDEARHAAAAHAAGERLKPDLLRALGLDRPRGLLGGSVAGLLADRLLAPTPWLADEGRACGWDLFALKQRFATASHERLALRLLDLDEPCVISVIDNGHVSKRRSNAFRVNKQLSAPEARVQQLVHRYSRPHDRNEEGWRVQGWPVHAADWKREILRAVPPDEDFPP
jgi:hypothetical protein